ncbi:MAG: tetratricopeptide repeat protein [Candidatus Omnitrophica bacterium]|nr:tetratricopeptide repeat protein [Candidatus Omnitrophota bacterium]
MQVLIGLCVLLVMAEEPAAWAEAPTRSLDELVGQVTALYREHRFAEAVPIAEEAIGVAERTYGPEHPVVAISLNNLAGLYAAQGQYGQAEPLYQQALAIKWKVLGPAHPGIAPTLNNFAGLYAAQGRYTDAELLYIHAINLLAASVGAKHPLVARVTNNLNQLLRIEMEAARPEPILPELEQPEGSEAASAEPAAPAGVESDTIALLKWKLRALEETVGSTHVHVAELLTGIAAQYRMQGQYDQAEPFYQRALAIVEQSAGPQGPSVAMAANNLAALYELQGRDADAEPLYLRALAINEQTSQDHRKTFADFTHLTDFYAARQRWADAKPLYKRWRDLIEDMYGPKDPEVASVLERYAACLEALGEQRKAQDLRTRAARIRSR